MKLILLLLLTLHTTIEDGIFELKRDDSEK